MTILKRFVLLVCVMVATLLTLAVPLAPTVQAAQSSRTGTWKLTGSMHDARSSHTATLLKNGLVLVTGGTDDRQVLADAELYHPATGRWTPTGKMHVARDDFTATLLRKRSRRAPTTIDPAKVQATYEHGVLTVHVPKTEEAKPQQIPIQPKKETAGAD